jgi:hypothetical protein
MALALSIIMLKLVKEICGCFCAYCSIGFDQYNLVLVNIEMGNKKDKVAKEFCKHIDLE